MVTNPSADTLYLQSTLPFGTSFAGETTSSSNRLFTSYDRSPSTGLDYAVNRTYSPTQGRFTTPDPIGMASVSPADPQSLNQFAYTRNTPTDFVDPSGLNLELDCRFAGSRTVELFGNFDIYVCTITEIGGGDVAGYGIGHVVPPPDQPQTSEKPKCPEALFTEDIQPGVGRSPVGVPLNFTQDELNNAAFTVFGEISSRVTPQTGAEARAVASEIFNRSLAIMLGQGNFRASSSSLSAVVSAPSQFAGFRKGLKDFTNFSNSPQANEFRDGERNCERFKAAIDAVRSIATDLNIRDPFLFNFSNFGGKRLLRLGEVRINGNDFSTNQLQP